MPARTKVALPLLLALLLSCTRAPQPQSGVPAARTSHAAPAGLPTALATAGYRAPIPDADLLEPLRALGPCTDVPRGGSQQSVEGLVLPPGAVLTQVTPAAPLTNVQGYLEMTPVQIRVFYQQHPDLVVLSVEDEIQESEVLVEAGGRRVFVKSQAVCELGSLFVAIVAPAAP